MKIYKGRSRRKHDRRSPKLSCRRADIGRLGFRADCVDRIAAVAGPLHAHACCIEGGNLGSCAVLIALAVHADDPAISLRALAGVVFFLLTVPISSHLLEKAAHGAGYHLWENSECDDLKAVLEQGNGSAPSSTGQHQSRPM